MSNGVALLCKTARYLKGRLVYLLVNFVIFLAGYVFILLGCNSVENTVKSSILFSIGASLIASAIVVFLDIWREIARENVLSQAFNIIVDAGVRGVHRKRDLDKYDQQMEAAQHVIDIAGYTLNAWYESYAELVLEKARQNPGLRLRILMVDPRSPFSVHRANQEGKSEASTEDSYERIRSAFAECKGAELRVVDTPMTSMIFRVDDVMYVGPHLFERPSKSTLTFELDVSGWLFSEFHGEFDRLWEHGRSPPAAQTTRSTDAGATPDVL